MVSQTKMYNMMGYGYPMMGYGYNGGWQWTLLSIFWWVLIFVVILAIVKWAAKEFRRKGIYEKSPTEILKERYAKGEITKQEYQEMKKELEK